MGVNHELFKKLADPDSIGQSEYRLVHDFLRDLYWDPVNSDEEQPPIDDVLVELSHVIRSMRVMTGVALTKRYLVWDYDQDDVVGELFESAEDAYAISDQLDNTIVVPVEWVDESPVEDEEAEDCNDRQEQD